MLKFQCMVALFYFLKLSFTIFMSGFIPLFSLLFLNFNLMYFSQFSLTKALLKQTQNDSLELIKRYYLYIIYLYSYAIVNNNCLSSVYFFYHLCLCFNFYVLFVHFFSLCIQFVQFL